MILILLPFLYLSAIIPSAHGTTFQSSHSGVIFVYIIILLCLQTISLHFRYHPSLALHFSLIHLLYFGVHVGPCYLQLKRCLYPMFPHSTGVLVFFYFLEYDITFQRPVLCVECFIFSYFIVIFCRQIFALCLLKDLSIIFAFDLFIVSPISTDVYFKVLPLQRI